jgi:hypothetical protein
MSDFNAILNKNLKGETITYLDKWHMKIIALFSVESNGEDLRSFEVL